MRVSLNGSSVIFKWPTQKNDNPRSWTIQHGNEDVGNASLWLLCSSKNLRDRNTWMGISKSEKKENWRKAIGSLYALWYIPQSILCWIYAIWWTIEEMKPSSDDYLGTIWESSEIIRTQEMRNRFSENRKTIHSRILIHLSDCLWRMWMHGNSWETNKNPPNNQERKKLYILSLHT